MESSKLLNLVLFGCVFFLSCSELKQPAPANLEPEVSAHPNGFLNKNSPDFHGLFIRTSGWNLGNCQECHAQDYSGGIAKNSCLDCHVDTPEDCVVCHGGTDNMTGAPPEDLAGNTDVTTRGVGLHTKHLTESSLRTAIDCESCHVVPNTFNASGHVGSDLPAELTFGGLAITGGVNPEWDTNNLTCANSYCHGNWSLPKSGALAGSEFIYTEDSMTGNNESPTWTDNTGAACGSCHGLPPTGHFTFALSACAGCHRSVIDGSGSIIDSAKHINGMINVFDMEYPMFN